MAAAELGRVAAPDGAELGYLRLGAGPPLVVCHGSFSSAQDWLPFAQEMAATNMVYLYDRRARGMSPFAGGFALETEVDDLAAIMALAGPGAALLGHSYGGGCALRLAARDQLAAPLIVYEPRHSAHGPMSRGRIPELETLLATGDLDAALGFAMTAIIGLPDPAVAAFRQSPQWAPMRATVAVLPGELRFLDSLAWRPGDLDSIPGRPWLLVGGNTPDSVLETALEAVLPAIRKRTLPGQGHFAYVSDPALMARTVRDCLHAD